MRVVIAFDLREGDADEVTSIFDYVLEKFSSKTLVRSIYDPEIFNFSEKMLVDDIDGDLLMEGIVDKIVTIMGYEESNISSYPNKLSHTLDLSIFADKLGEVTFEETHGE